LNLLSNQYSEETSMNLLHRNVRTSKLITACFIAGNILLGLDSVALANGHEKFVGVEALPNVSGKSITAIMVRYAGGEKSPAHRHAGSVFAYVLAGSIRSENSATGAAKIYNAGEFFFEPPGSVHRISENASATEPASLLAIFVADSDAKLTTPDK
jgi:quercetin dioxygenase-like cupin family protein